tara:strand:- start:6569 stop:7216 length:648 start_codon:yes stop_codon:yes gene_type:complete
LQTLLYVCFLSFILSSCAELIPLETNLPNYKMHGEGKIKNPVVLFFRDPAVLANDSIAKYLTKTYYVINIEKVYKNTLLVLNEDHPKLRGVEGLEIHKQLSKKFVIHNIAASGMEAAVIITWFTSLPFKKALLYPYYQGSLIDHLKKAIGTGSEYLIAYKPMLTSVEFYSILKTDPLPSGRLGIYSYRFIEALWILEPSLLLTPYEGVVETYIVH